jgi:GDP-mannose 6-dehydrogenase
VLSAILHSNRQQTERAIEMVLATGKKHIGVLGMSFKSGTDDLRESPMVTVIEALIGKGLQLAIYDRDVSVARLVGANKEYIEREIPHISTLMRPTIEEVVSGAQVLIIGNRSKEFATVERDLRKDHIVIDLVRLIEGRSSDTKYHGICW